MTDNHHTPARRRCKSHFLLMLLKWAWLFLTVCESIATVIAANAGLINPEIITWPALIAMGFPVLIAVNSLLGIINLFVSKRVAIVQWAAMILSIGAIGYWFPAHPFSSPAVPDSEDDIIRFMTYNTYGFVDDENIYPDHTNRTASAIIQSGADIICLQEVGMLVDMPVRSLNDEQIDSINEIYPYFVSEEKKMVSILSKYPLKEIYLDQPDNSYTGWQAAEASIGNDTVLIVSVHLQSFGLNDEDKLIYHNITKGDVSRDITGAGRILYHKLTDAMRLRAAQAQTLRHQLDSLGYPNVILSGDFNDIAGCYAMRQLCKGNLKSVFHEIGNGPVITYHSDRFLFNIDHILYKGNVTPIRYRRGNIKSSDHYPVYITFKKD